MPGNRLIQRTRAFGARPGCDSADEMRSCGTSARAGRSRKTRRTGAACRWDGDYFNRNIGGYAGIARREEWVCAMQFQETILQRLGKTLHVRMDDITHEPLPRRWVDLIHHLDDHERKQAERHGPNLDKAHSPE